MPSNQAQISKPKKRKQEESDESNDIESDEEKCNSELPLKHFYNKNVGRYKKVKINESVELNKVPKNLPAVEPKSFALLNRQVTAPIKTLNTINDHRFINFISHQAYYMFVVSKSRNSQNKYRITYANCVAAVTTEYAANYQKIDHLVMVVSIEQFRFMISYNLLINLNIPIPASEDLGKKCCDASQLSKRCFFNEVKDFEFKSLLIHTFQLDVCYAKTKMILLFNALGSDKTDCVMETMKDLHKDELFSQLPVNLYQREATEDMRYDISPYVLSIVNLSEGLTFRKASRPANDTEAINDVINVLRFWLREKNVRSADTKDKDCFFTYKYGSIVRLFYDDSPKIKNLTKLKKANNATSGIITSYLEVSSSKNDSDNFLLISTKNDERITIIKKGYEYIWITSVISDIIASDIINAFKKHTHHVFNLNNSTRKEVNYKHNGLIKLMSFYTSDYLSFSHMFEISKKFNCNFKSYTF
ncbi:IE-1 [Buzura suppressaria nucleopolyhedrovirus]|nr:IE-1 [Buzura suppressaria nucleopolyhedrovirus]AHH82603.1 IE-1 [Buzura suppressaria nucleopolyhedrovirus]